MQTCNCPPRDWKLFTSFGKTIAPVVRSHFRKNLLKNLQKKKRKKKNYQESHNGSLPFKISPLPLAFVTIRRNIKKKEKNNLSHPLVIVPGVSSRSHSVESTKHPLSCSLVFFRIRLLGRERQRSLFPARPRLSLSVFLGAPRTSKRRTIFRARTRKTLSLVSGRLNVHRRRGHGEGIG